MFIETIGGQSAQFNPLRSGYMTAFQIEFLETRQLFSLAPTSIEGLNFSVIVTAGSFPFADTGSYVFRSAESGNRYVLDYGDDINIPNSEGAYSYARTSDNVGTIIAHDDLVGGLTGTLIFDTSSTGSFVLASPGAGSQTGSFIQSGASAPSFASLLSQVLRVAGTTGDDLVGLSLKSSQINVTQNGQTQKFQSSLVGRIEIFAGSGNDRLLESAVARPIYIDGGAGNDSLTGGDGADTLTGGAGKNTLAGGGGADRINGSGGRDLIFGGAGDDRLFGNGGNDTLDGGGNVDRIFGGDGDDSLIGASSNDKLYGQAGNDTLIGAAGSDILDGGDGIDLADNDNADTRTGIESIL